MNNEPIICEKPCNCCQGHQKTDLIVLTGGPGAGKTAVLESARKLLCEHVTILPEAASIVFGGGFWRLESGTARMASQRAIFHVQSEMETLVKDEGRWGIGLCDRGTLDGLAYWIDSEAHFWETFSTSKEEHYRRYKAVIHLSSPTRDKGYNHQNPVRIESAEEAGVIDDKIYHVWKDHPNYYRVDSTDTFLEKVNTAFLRIKEFMPECCRGHFD